MDEHIRHVVSADGTKIAYWAAGAGRPVIGMATLFSHLGVELRHPRPSVLGLAAKYQLVKYDPRGQGLSERAPAALSLQAAQEDLEAVIDAMGFEQVVLFAPAQAGPIAIAMAANRPERVSHLVLANSFVRYGDYFESRIMQALLPLATHDWNLFTATIAQARYSWSGGAGGVERGRVLQASMTPDFFQRLIEAQESFDATDLLEKVHVPTLVVHRPSYSILDSTSSSFLASRIAGAKLVFLDEGPGGEGLGGLLNAMLDFAPPWTARQPAGPGPKGVALSPREVQVLSLLTQGIRNQDIARELRISVPTVERHLTNIYLKVGATSRVEAVTFALGRDSVGSGLRSGRG